MNAPGAADTKPLRCYSPPELGNLELLPLQMKHTKMKRVPVAAKKIF